MPWVLKRSASESVTWSVRIGSGHRTAPVTDEVGDGLNLPAAPKQVNHETPLGEECLSSMNARIPIRALGLLVPLILAPVLARAQVIPSPYRYIDSRQGLGLILGTSSVNPGRFGYGPSGGTVIGVRWGIDFSGPIGLEAVVTGIKGTRDIIDPGHAAGHRHVGTANTLLGTVEGRLRFSLTGNRTWHDLAPFVVMGGGVVFDIDGSQPADSLVAAASRFNFGRSFIGTMGGGVRWMVSHRLAFRGDALFSLWKLKTPPGFTDPTLGFVSVAKSEWANGYQLTLSTVIRF
jgi:hypothetical protein